VLDTKSHTFLFFLKKLGKKRYLDIIINILKNKKMGLEKQNSENTKSKEKNEIKIHTEKFKNKLRTIIPNYDKKTEDEVFQYLNKRFKRMQALIRSGKTK
jgi:hypothetical protein